MGSNPIGGAESDVKATARYANRQSGQAQTLVTCGFDSHSCQSIRSRVVFLTAVCKPVAFKSVRR